MIFRRLAAVGVAALLLAAACSSSDDSGAEAEATVADAPTSTTADSVADAPTSTTADSVVGPPDPTAPPTAEPDTASAGAVQVEIVTADGETLTANYTALEGAPGVVLGHMRGTGKETWDAFAEPASEAGFAVLAIDSRGYGGSTGERDTDLDVDLAAGVDFLLDAGSPSVVVIGASMNGTATVVAGTQLDLAGVATLSAPGQFAGLDAVAAAPAVTAPSLIVVAAEDEPYASVAPSLVGGGGGELVVFPGNSHGTALLDEFGPALTDRLIEFLTQVTS